MSVVKLSITKKLIIIIFLPLLLDAAEIFLFDFTANTFSTIRAYVAGEGLWSKAQKDALNALYKYTTRPGYGNRHCTRASFEGF